MIVNRNNLTTLQIAFAAAFAQGLGMAGSQWNQVATEVPSATGSNEYGWLGQVPNMREWLGDRQVYALAQHGYTIKNKTWENTIGVPREAIEDDQFGIYTPLFQEQGRAVAAHPDTLVFSLLTAGFATVCYDGQFFFDTDHPVIDATGAVASVSNTGGGAGTPWFVLDTSRAIKPLLLQMRKRPEFVAKDKPTDDNVFDRNEFRYGVDGRWNAGFGFWQMAYGSKQALDEAALTTAIAAIGSFKGDGGRPLGLRPTLLVVPPSLEVAARKLVVAQTTAAGASNVLQNAVQLLVSPWLA